MGQLDAGRPLLAHLEGPGGSRRQADRGKRRAAKLEKLIHLTSAAEFICKFFKSWGSSHY